MTLSIAYAETANDAPIPGTLRPAYGNGVSPGNLLPAYGINGLSWLFANDAAGYLNEYIPLSTLWQNSNGTTAVTAAGDPLGLIENTVNASPDLAQATAGSRGALAYVPQTALINRLAAAGVTSEAFNGATWVKVAVTVTDAFDGVYAKIAETTANSGHNVGPAAILATTSGVTYTVFFDVKPGTEDWIQVFGNSASFGTTVWANFNVTTGTVGSNIGAGVVATSITLNADGSYRCAVQAVATVTTATTSAFAFALTNNTDAASRGPSYVGDAAEFMLVSRAFFGAGTIASLINSYQKVTSLYLTEQSGKNQIPAVYLASDFATYGVTNFGAATQGLYAAAGQNWNVLVAFATFSTGNLIAQTDQATATDRMFQVAVDATTLQLFATVRGANNNLLAAANSGAWIVCAINCNNGVVTARVNRAARTTLTVGTAAAEAVNILAWARSTASPTAIFTGRSLPPMLIDRSLSDAEESQAVSSLCNYLGIA